METLNITTREFRQNQSSFLDAVNEGTEIILNRNRKGVKEKFMIIKLEEDDLELTISQKLKDKIDEARRQYKDGLTVTCETREDLEKYLKSL